MSRYVRPIELRVEMGQYRMDLVEALAGGVYRAFMLTARPERHKAATPATLGAIGRRIPELVLERAYFNTHDEQPPDAKRRMLKTFILPDGIRPEACFAIVEDRPGELTIAVLGEERQIELLFVAPAGRRPSRRRSPTRRCPGRPRSPESPSQPPRAPLTAASTGRPSPFQCTGSSGVPAGLASKGPTKTGSGGTSGAGPAWLHGGLRGWVSTKGRFARIWIIVLKRLHITGRHVRVRLKGLPATGTRPA